MAENNEYEPGDYGSRDWIPEDALVSAQMEKTVHPNETEEDQTRRLFRENAAVAAQSIIHLSVHSPNERTRLAAASYVVNRVLGMPGDDSFGQNGSPLEKLFKDLEKMANSNPTA